jgi:hypothetical protein
LLQPSLNGQLWGQAVATSPEGPMIAAVTTDRGVYVSSPDCAR